MSESGSNESFQLEDTPPNQLHSVVDTVSAMGKGERSWAIITPLLLVII